MLQKTYQSSSLPATASTVASAGGVSWANPSRITAKDGSSATLAFLVGADTGAIIRGTGFVFKKLPPSAVIDGMMVRIKGTQTGCNGLGSLNIPGTATKVVGSLDETWGGIGYFWGLTALTPADLVGLQVQISMDDAFGGSGVASMDYMEVTIFWHIQLPEPLSVDLNTTFAYKVFSKDGAYLGDLPNVTSPFAFTQDINSAGVSLQTVCNTSPKPVTTTEAILDNNSDPIQTDASLSILADSTTSPLVPGDSDESAIFKNGNRLKVWMYDKWNPNGKLVFSGQVNRIDFTLGESEGVTVKSFSDGMDLENYYARGYPFTYTTDQQQTTQNSTVTLIDYNPGATLYGQSFTTGVGIANVGEIQLLLLGSADVTLSVYDNPNGNYLGSVTRTITGANLATPTKFALPQLIPTVASTGYFFSISLGAGQSIDLGLNTAGGYASGSGYQSDYSGGSGGGSFYPIASDLWFKTGVGTPTTTTTYTTQDPVTGMASGILLDYNSRGGRIVAGSLVAAGYTLTYTFNSATINSAIQKILELCPAGYYAFVDVGLGTIDIRPTSTTADFVVVIGRDVSKINFSLTIEQVKNQLLFSGGDIGAGENLFKQYQDTQSSDNYDPRLAQKSDNRVILDATADAIGTSFIDENASEIQETSVTLLKERVDITKYVPGKTISFQNSGMFVDNIVLQIVRREFTKDSVTLTIGRLPVTQTAEVQRLNREMLNEQTIANPDQPD